MKQSILKALSSFIGLSLIASVVSVSESLEDRQQKHFSLFSVVTFKNEECTSELTGGSGGNRAGTCHTSTECTDMSGMKSGNCAAGFGVCCVFLSNTGISATVTNNRTLIRNAEYSAIATATAATDISYTINKMSSDICQIRLDFIDFVLGGPINSNEIIGGTTTLTHCTNDVMTITNAGSGAEVPLLCGALTGEHLYIDMGMDATDTTVVRIQTAISTALGPTIAARMWDIKTSQIECYATYRAPEGCHRWMTADVGKIISYNFRRTGTAVPTAQTATTGQNSGVELASQNVKTCIRRSKGMCCLEFLLCTQYNGIALTEVASISGAANDGGNLVMVNEGWSIDIDSSETGFVNDGIGVTNAALATGGANNAGFVDSMCWGDYVEIPSSWSGACGAGHSSARSHQNTRYCGGRFGFNFQAAYGRSSHTPVCDCSEPWTLNHYSNYNNDAMDDAFIVGNLETGTAYPRGFCIDYRQAPCYF